MMEVHIFQEGSIYFKYIPNIGKYNFEVCGQGEQMVGFKSVMASHVCHVLTRKLCQVFT